MAERTLSTLLEGGDFFEGPRFQSGRWWVSDFYRHRVLTVDGDGREEVVMEVEGQPSGLGWMPDGWPSTSMTTSSRPSASTVSTRWR